MLNFEENFYFDENLRAVPKNKHVILDRIQELENKMLHDEGIIKTVNHLSELGFLNKVLLNLAVAESYSRQAMTLIKEGNLGSRLYVIHGIRLANIWQWQERFEDSNPMFEEIIEICEKVEESKDLLDFSYQHMGKNLFDQERYAEALLFFEKALALRKVKNKQGPIDSTNLAIATTAKKIG